MTDPSLDALRHLLNLEHRWVEFLSADKLKYEVTRRGNEIT
jgi:hypothetical protein